MKNEQGTKGSGSGSSGTQQVLESLVAGIGGLTQTIGRIDQRMTRTEEVVKALVESRHASAPVGEAVLPPPTFKRGPGRPRKETTVAPPVAVAVATPVVPPEPVPAPPPKLDVRQKIELALTTESLDTARLAKAVGETQDRVSKVLTALKAEDLVYNVGYEDSAIWTWKVGDAVDTPTLIRVVKKLLSERPMGLRDVIRATGVKESRVSGAIVEVQRMCRVEDLSGGGHAKKYFVVGEHWRDVSLAPKVFKGASVRHGGRRDGTVK